MCVYFFSIAVKTCLCKQIPISLLPTQTKRTICLLVVLQVNSALNVHLADTEYARHRPSGILKSRCGSITNRGGVRTLSLSCFHAGSIRSRGTVCRFGERRCSIRHSYRRHGRAYISDTEVAPADDILRCESADHGDRLPKAAAGNLTVAGFFVLWHAQSSPQRVGS